MKQNDLLWFQPLWRRIAVTAVCVAWTAFEWWNGDQFWGLLTSGLVLYCLWTFFYAFKSPEPPRTGGKPGDDGTPPKA